MSSEPTHDQLVQRIRELEKDVAGRHFEVRRLLESEQTYRSLFENTGLLGAIYDQNGICVLMNRKVASLFGGSPKDFLGKSMDDPHPEAAGEFKRRIFQVIRSGQVMHFEDRLPFPDGNRWLLSSVHPIVDRSGGNRLCQILSIDITDRKRIEDRLIQFKTAVEHASDAIGMALPEGRHWYQNESFDRLFGDIGDDPPGNLYVDEALGREVFKTIMPGMGGGQTFDRIRTIDPAMRI